MSSCRDALTQRSGQSTRKWETMYRVGQQSQPGSKGRGAPVVEPHSSRPVGVEAQLKGKCEAHRVRCWKGKGTDGVPGGFAARGDWVGRKQRCRASGAQAFQAHLLGTTPGGSLESGPRRSACLQFTHRCPIEHRLQSRASGFGLHVTEPLHSLPRRTHEGARTPHPQPNPTTPNDSNHHDPRTRELRYQPPSCAPQVRKKLIRPCLLRRVPSST